jgi:hypothetical protein
LMNWYFVGLVKNYWRPKMSIKPKGLI